MLHEIVSALNHSYVDVLKVDIEGDDLVLSSFSLYSLDITTLLSPDINPSNPTSSQSIQSLLLQSICLSTDGIAGCEHPWIRAEPLTVFHQIGN